MSCGKINTNIGGCCQDIINRLMNDYVSLINKAIEDNFKGCDLTLCRIDNHVNHIELFYDNRYFAKLTWGYERGKFEDNAIQFTVTTTYI